MRVVLSGRRRNMQPKSHRIDIRPVLIKGELLLQTMENDGRQTTTRNVSFSNLNILNLMESGFANILVEHETGSMTIRVTKNHDAQVHYDKDKREQNLEHDRTKARLLSPSDPFLREVGISDDQGRIKPSRQDKYRQVEEFLRLLSPALTEAIEAGHLERPSQDRPLSIVDLGCGNAYLTFAAHQYLRGIGMPVHVTGIDIRAESRNRNVEIAAKLEIKESMDFVAAEISQAEIEEVDVAIALHACDTATDDAIAWAINNDAKLLLIAPCCHHDLQSQIKGVPEPWTLITKHGLLKERLADLMTDALRAQILRILGYRTDIVEFVGGEHTPRNLMIRAIKTGAKSDPTDIARYLEMVDTWKVHPALAKRLAARLAWMEKSDGVEDVQ
ncbi:MAG TPA: SAM-dependent methyltransferase [Candidatus Nanopelagicaceae bacterium]